MSGKYFSSDRDRTIIEARGFFCKACLVGKLASEQSPDPRYCQGCYEFLSAEVKLLGRGKKPSRVPVVGHYRRYEALPVSKEPVAKLSDKGKDTIGNYATPCRQA